MFQTEDQSKLSMQVDSGDYHLNSPNPIKITLTANSNGSSFFIKNVGIVIENGSPTTSPFSVCRSIQIDSVGANFPCTTFGYVRLFNQFNRTDG
jgi:hypothetical protein